MLGRLELGALEQEMDAGLRSPWTRIGTMTGDGVSHGKSLVI